MTSRVILAALLLATVSLSAQDAKAPTLPEAAKLKIVALQQQIEIYQLREQLARQALAQELAAAQVPGYRLTDQLDYVPVEPAKDAAPNDAPKP